jgi:hypothetical protein
MARRRVKLKRNVEEIVESAKAMLDKLRTNPAEGKIELDATIKRLVSLNRDLRELSLHHTQKLLSRDSAAERILDYLRLHVGEKVEGEELDVVSTISEYPRRIREWRVQFGWPIVRRGRHYILKRDQPDTERAERWRKMNEIRRTDAAKRDKMLALFRAFPGQVITYAELQYVSGGADMRRVRELRTELGWRILSRNTGMPELKQGEYVLIDPDPVEEHDRHVDDKTVVAVLRRDGNSCRKQGCGWHPRDRTQGDPRQYVELHHIQWHVEGGRNEADNLITLCNVHHKEVHRLGIGPSDFDAWLQEPDG